MDNYDIGTRAVRLAEYITETGATVRAAAAKFGVSKSTVHKDVSVRLKRQDPSLYREVRAVLEKNLLERHIRGGKATKLKYLAEKELTKSGN
ncbi:MAG: sporulation transcriptional regulator SpoIIID [Eubacteriales bacterium]